MSIPDEDIRKLKGIFVTKEEFNLLKQDVSQLKSNTYDVKEELGEFKEQTSTNFDKVMKVLEEIRTELIVSHEQYRRHDEKLENHEKRLVVLEST